MAVRILLLRGINVGGKHRLPMKELVRLMEADGFRNVRTYIQSGNVVCDGMPAAEQRVGDLIERNFGFRPGVFDLSAAALRRAREALPFAPAEGRHLHLFFLDRTPPRVDEDLLAELREGREEYRLVKRVFYLHAPDGLARSKLVARLHKALPGVDMTARNLNTVDKLLEMSAKP